MNPPAPPQETAAILPPDPVQSAKAAGLRYVSDRRPGIRRERAGDSFRYRDKDGQPIRDEDDIAPDQGAGDPAGLDRRLDLPRRRAATSRRPGATPRGASSTAITPAGGEVRDETKYDRMMAFGRALPRSAARVEHDLARPGLPREKVLATVVRLLETTLIRVGNEEYARTNRSLRPDHPARPATSTVAGRRSRFHFRGKSGKYGTPSTCNDRRLAHDRQALPGPARPGAVPVPRRRTGERADDRLGGRERVPARDHRPGLHRQGLPHLGRHGAGRAGPAGVRGVRLGDAGQEERRRGRSSRSPSGWATRPPSAASATSTRRSSTRTWTARWSTRYKQQRRAGTGRIRFRSYRRRRPPCWPCSSNAWARKPEAGPTTGNGQKKSA